MSQISGFADSAYQSLTFYIFAKCLLDAMQPRNQCKWRCPSTEGPCQEPCSATYGSWFLQLLFLFRE